MTYEISKNDKLYIKAAPAFSGNAFCNLQKLSGP